MAKWKNRMKRAFPSAYAEYEGLPLLLFPAYGRAKYKILIAGSEYGDMGFCADAVLKAAKLAPLQKTHVDFVPVLDADGHPSARVLAAEAGFEDAGFMERGGHIAKLKQILKSGGYDLAVQATGVFIEEWPFCNGYFVNIAARSYANEGRGRNAGELRPEAKDLAGAIVNEVKLAANLQSLHDNYSVGRRYAFLSEGVLASCALDDKGGAYLQPRNWFALTCQAEPLILVAPAQRNSSNRLAFASHSRALEAVIRMYEGC